MLIKLTIRHGNKKLKTKILRLFIETEIQSKYEQKKKIRKKIRELNISLKTSLNITLYNCIIHQVNAALKSKLRSINKRHNKKPIKFCVKGTNDFKGEDVIQTNYIKHTVQNFPRYALSDEEYNALSYGLDHYVPSTSSYNAINTKFALFYQNLLTNISHILHNRLLHNPKRIP